jgi:hypothetical protein
MNRQQQTPERRDICVQTCHAFCPFGVHEDHVVTESHVQKILIRRLAQHGAIHYIQDKVRNQRRQSAPLWDADPPWLTATAQFPQRIEVRGIDSAITSASSFQVFLGCGQTDMEEVVRIHIHVKHGLCARINRTTPFLQPGDRRIECLPGDSMINAVKELPYVALGHIDVFFLPGDHVVPNAANRVGTRALPGNAECMGAIEEEGIAQMRQVLGGLPYKNTIGQITEHREHSVANVSFTGGVFLGQCEYVRLLERERRRILRSSPNVGKKAAQREQPGLRIGWALQPTQNNIPD